MIKRAKLHANGSSYDHRFRVRSGIPIPPRCVYPFHRMEVGDSFMIPATVSENSVRSAASQYIRRHGRTLKFSVVRVYGDQFGCWRVK